MKRGLPGRLGATGVLDVDDVKVILISYRWQTLDPEMIRFTGIDRLGEKSPGRQVHDPLPRGLRADRQGDHRGRCLRTLSSNLARFAFTRVRRPIFPLDPEMTCP